MTTEPEHGGAIGPGPILLYDGSCGFCSWTVQLVLQHEKQSTLRFAALQSPVARRILERAPELAGVDSIFWVDADANGSAQRILVRSTAVLRVARYLGGWWSFLLAGFAVPRSLRDRLYDLFAKHRSGIIQNDRCILPTPDQRRRFLDAA